MTTPLAGIWQELHTISGRRYKCGYCDSDVGPDKGWWCYEIGGTGVGVGYVYVCSHCNRPTFFDESEARQYPGIMSGNPVESLPNAIERLYNEARAATSVEAYTSAVLSLRKLLMNIAVNKGARQRGSFRYYVDYLASKHYVSPDSKEWVDRIRRRGNDANHEIVLMEKSDADDLLSLAEMLLKIIYEFPSRGSKGKSSKVTRQPLNQ